MPWPSQRKGCQSYPSPSLQTLLRWTLSQVFVHREMAPYDRRPSCPPTRTWEIEGPQPSREVEWSLHASVWSYEYRPWRIGHVHNQGRSFREVVSKDPLLCRGSVTFTFLSAAGRSLARTTRLDSGGDPTSGLTQAAPGSLAQVVLGTRKAEEGFSTRDHRCHTTYSHRAFVTSAILARLASLPLPRTWVDVPRNTRHGVHDTSDAARLSPPK